MYNARPPHFPFKFTLESMAYNFSGAFHMLVERLNQHPLTLPVLSLTEEGR